MEKIKKRSMTSFVMSSFINFCIGLAFGIIVWIITAVVTERVDFKEFFNIVIYMAVFVALFTTNIYRIYFFYTFSIDVNRVCIGDGDESDNYLIACILSIVTFGVYRIYWVYKIAQRIRANAPKYGFKIQETGKEIAALYIFSFGYISVFELIKNMNRIADSYNKTIKSRVGGVQTYDY